MKNKRTLSRVITLLMIFSMIPVITAATGAAEYVFTDSLDDFLKIHEFSVDVSRPDVIDDFTFFQIDSATRLGEDQTLMINAGYWAWYTDEGYRPYFTWKVNGGAKVEFMAYHWNDGVLDFPLAWSADGENFFELIPDSVVTVSTETAEEYGVADEYDMNGTYEIYAIYCRLYTIDKIDESAAYFRITWPEGMVNSYEAAPTMLRATGGVAHADTTHIIKSALYENYDYFYDYSPDLFYVDAFPKDPPCSYLILDYGFLSGKKELPEIFVTYNVKEGSPFMFQTVRHSVFKTLELSMKWYSSADNADWVEITDYSFTEEESGLGGFELQTFSVGQLPEGHVYVKIVWPNEEDYVDYGGGYAVTYGLGLMMAKYNKAAEEEASSEPQGPIENDPREITAGKRISFTTDKNADAKLMHSFNEDAIDFDQILQIDYENYPVLMLGLDFIEGKDSLPEAYVAYKVDGGSPVAFVCYSHVNAVDLGLYMTLFWSADGKSWALAETVYVKEATETKDWLKETYGIKALPAEANYFKIVWPHEKDYTGTAIPDVKRVVNDTLCYAPSLVEITFNATEAPAEAPVETPAVTPAGPSQAPIDSPPPSDDSGGANPIIIIAIIAGVVVVAGLAVLFIVLSRKKKV